ncbi:MULTISPECIES: zinc-binding dehydrogenase [Bosea]|uniref:zinc-dependent alcohol dehydrogenase n=1 Tax=Bosea TaxID=85413 RepID=UPI00215032D4|nr:MULTISPECIES: alcohol dehydrogenase catalytic domain-containing protein [Bosea]MCR4521600.1 alcohol dehydrogenase catalytic domain-containing protein [Bosea sp. 47.2.35]MDR6829345.1 L-iditol 2-dehydrogenase [Bosea robiniae]MDR6896140.1 L-iditol 2-dehydrogenase [Bosea sp. BE109]MDR7139626.1 L-iditol 2-dehydrogenase [Bosea sp. BE168]MDR7176235.1 L-iditol 2-dehydrogenase [Bosea sp. BE271]
MSRAVFLHAAGDARVAPFNLREGAAGETLLDVAAVGLCGSDLHYYKDGGIGSAVIAEPFVPGHEFSGWLTEDLPELGLERGALVAVDPNQACGHCEHCRNGHPNLCPEVVFIGAPPHDGAMTERIWVPKSQIVAVPQDFSPSEAVMLEPLGVAIHAVDLAKPRLLERVALIGCGPIGLLILQVLRTAGVGEILACDPQPHRRELALRLGASKAGASVADIAEWTKGEGLPLVIEATNAPEGFRDAIRAARIGGRVVLVGIPDGDSYVIPAAEARRRGLNIKFSRRMGHVYPRAIELVAQGKVDVEAVVSHRFPLADGPAAFRRHADNEAGMVKSMIYPGGLPEDRR